MSDDRRVHMIDRLRQNDMQREIDRLTKALQGIYNVPWTSSGRGDIPDIEQYIIALAHKDRIASEALKMDSDTGK